MKHIHVLLPLLLLVLILAACGDAANPAATSSAPKPPAPSPTPTPEPHHKVGDTVTRDGFAITLTSVKLIDPASIPQHEQIFPDVKGDKTFLVLDEHAKNTANKDQSLVGMQLVFQDTEGNHFTAYSGVNGIDGVGLGGPMAPGMQQHGMQVFAVPKSVHDFNWLYEPNAGTQVVWDIHV